MGTETLLKSVGLVLLSQLGTSVAIEPAVDCICNYLGAHRDGEKGEVMGSSSLLGKNLSKTQGRLGHLATGRSISILPKEEHFNIDKRL